MKFPNYLTSTLAIVGAFSLIVMACSANDNNSATTTTNSVGKYQITSTTGNGFYVIDTETGVVKTYVYSSISANYDLYRTTSTQP